MTIPLNPILPDYIHRYDAGGATADKLRELAIINFAYRPAPLGSATGGPNGVMKVQQELLGASYRGVPLYYFYEPRGLKLPPMWQTWAKNQQLKTMGRNILSAHNFVQNLMGNFVPHQFLARSGTGFHFFCHDIGTAAAASFFGYKFTLMYHNQGSFINERTSFGEELNAAERYLFNHYEKVAFENAERVYFPSRGAQEAFFATTEVVDRSKVRLADRPLYNTVVDFAINDGSVEPFLRANGLDHLLDPEVRSGYTVFISVGDYTANKGIDRCPEVLSRVASNSDKKILWIVIGNKHNSGIYESLVEMAPSLPFETCFIPNRIPHAEGMALTKWADWLFMLQRHAIFDFSTLEAMKIGKGVILSPLGGNLEFNRRDNVIYVDPENFDDDHARKVAESDAGSFGELNREVFSEAFSPEAFAESYRRMYDDIINASLIEDVLRVLPEVETGAPRHPLASSEVAKELGKKPAKPTPPPEKAANDQGRPTRGIFALLKKRA